MEATLTVKQVVRETGYCYQRVAFPSPQCQDALLKIQEEAKWASMLLEEKKEKAAMKDLIDELEKIVELKELEKFEFEEELLTANEKLEEKRKELEAELEDLRQQLNERSSIKEKDILTANDKSMGDSDKRDIVKMTPKCTLVEKECQTDSSPMNMIPAIVPDNIQGGISGYHYLTLSDERHVRRLFCSKTDFGDCNANELDIANLHKIVSNTENKSDGNTNQIVHADSIEAFSKLMDCQIDAIRKSSQKFGLFRFSKRKKRVAKNLDQMKSNMVIFLEKVKSASKGQK